MFAAFDLAKQRKRTSPTTVDAVLDMIAMDRGMPDVSDRTLRDTADRHYGGWPELVAEYETRGVSS